MVEVIFEGTLGCSPFRAVANRFLTEAVEGSGGAANRGLSQGGNAAAFLAAPSPVLRTIPVNIALDPVCLRLPARRVVGRVRRHSQK